MTSSELFAAMPAGVALEIIEFAHAGERKLYKAALDAVAQARKVRPLFLAHQPKNLRHQGMVVSLGRPSLAPAATTLLHNWLFKKHTALLADFLDALEIKHSAGMVDDLPATVDDAKLKAAVELVVARHSREAVAIYLHTFHVTNTVTWPNLEALLKADSRLHYPQPTA